jgi:hypothetical protein
MRQGLLSLVEGAATTLPWAVARIRPTRWDKDVRELISKVCLECFGGQYGWAVNTSLPYDLYTPPDWWNACRHLLDDNQEWAIFHHAVRLAADLDTFLFVMERHAPVLARHCREDLDLLGVLADWCEDAGLPHAAAETRYHAERVRDWRRGPMPSGDLPDRNQWAGMEME